MKYEIEPVDNGYIASWWDDTGEETVQHHKVFEIPDSIDTNQEDLEALIDLLYFVKEEVAGQYHSKHKAKNVVVKFEGQEE